MKNVNHRTLRQKTANISGIPRLRVTYLQNKSVDIEHLVTLKRSTDFDRFLIGARWYRLIVYEITEAEILIASFMRSVFQLKSKQNMQIYSCPRLITEDSVC